jgi:hypothetical protein
MDATPSLLLQISAARFTAGLVLDAQLCVVEAAPILRYMLGWPVTRVAAYCKTKGWRGRVVR